MARLAETGILKNYLDSNCNWVQNLDTIKPETKYIITAKSSKRALDIFQGKSDDGTIVQQYQYHKGENQQFKIIKRNDSLYSILSPVSGKVLSVASADIENGTPVCIAKDSGGVGQRFILDKVSPGFFKIRVTGTNMLMDISGSSIDNEAHLQIWDNTGGNNQIFRFTETNECIFCPYNDDIPSNTILYIWNDDRVFSLTGSWLSSKKPYNELIYKILSTPKYFIWFFRDAVVCTARQLIQINAAAGFERLPRESPPGWAINAFLSRDYNQFCNSKQVNGYLNMIDFNNRIYFMMILSLLIIGIYLFNQSADPFFKRVVILIFFVVVYNAFVTGALANVLDRLQSRIMWVIPLCAILVGMDMLFPLILKFRNTGKR